MDVEDLEKQLLTFCGERIPEVDTTREDADVARIVEKIRQEKDRTELERLLEGIQKGGTEDWLI